MAPSKPKPPTKPVSKDRVGNNARVAKRPQRGFHRFRDGTLNLKPKSKDEKKIFKENQENSPLLRLPPEIRNIIWGHALGGKTFVAKSSTTTRSARTTLASSRKDPKNGSALLRTCRQLFLETAPYLLTHGTIEFAGQNVDYFDLHPALKAYQRDCVKRIRMSFPGVDQTLQWEISRVKDLYWTLLRLPALDEVEVLFHDVVDPDGKDFQSRRDDITKRITKRAKDKGYMFKLKVRGTSEKLDRSRLY